MEMETSTSQRSGCDPPVEGDSSTPTTPTVTPASIVSTPNLKDADISTDDSAHGHVAPNPSFSYNVPPNANNTNSESPHQSSANTTTMNSPAPSSFPRPSFSYNIPQPETGFSGGQSLHPRMTITHPSPFLAGMPPPSPVALPPSNTANFSYNGNHQLLQKDQSKTAGHIAQGPIVSPSVPHTTVGPTSTNSNFTPPQFWMPPGPPFQPPPGAPRAPVATSGPPQQPIYASYPPRVGPPQGVWLQPARPQLLPYPPAFPNSFPLPAQHMPRGVGPTFSAVSGSTPNELPPGTDNSKHVNAVGVKEESVVAEQLDAWSAHRTETGIIYYYNAVTGQSTYQKPAGFKGEPDKVYAQPTPIAWEKCAGTDWSLVTTNDGKRYYYNAKTKLSSWQIPTDVTESRKKQENDISKEQPTSIPIPNATVLTEKISTPIMLRAPAINTGGRDAISPNTPGVHLQSSALDLIKKKLQDSTLPTTSLPHPTSISTELNGSGILPADQMGKGSHSENGKDKIKDENLSNSSSDSEDEDSGPTKEERAIQFKEMLKERGVAPFSKWEKELPKFVFDPRFKAIPSYSARRAIFDHFVRTRAEEERKEKRAAQKAAIESYKQLLDEAKEDIDHNTDYLTFKRKWGHDSRFEACDRKEREALLNERVLPLKRSIEEEARAKRVSFKSMLRDNKDISLNSRWSKVKDIVRNDPRYKSIRHEEREALFNEYLSELKESEGEAERAVKAKRDEEEKLKERERALRKRKEREEQEVERVRSKARRKEAIESYQALLVETIKDPQVSWTDAKTKLDKDPQRRAANSYLDQSDLEKLFREHIKLLHDRCAHEYKALLGEVITNDAATKEYEDGKTVLTSWSTAKRLLQDDNRYNKMPRKDRESLWRRHVDDLQRRRKSTVDQELEKHGDGRTVDSRKYISGSRRNHDR